MKLQEYYTNGILFLLLLCISGCHPRQETQAPLALTWEMGKSYPEKDSYENFFVLKNLSNTPVNNDWTIYYAQFPHHIQQDEAATVKVEWISGTYHKIYPNKNFTPLAPGDSLIVTFTCDGEVPKNSHAPEGGYWVSTSGAGKGTPLPVKMKTIPLAVTKAQTAFLHQLYERNERLLQQPSHTLCETDILPTVKQVTTTEGKMMIPSKVTLSFHKDFYSESKQLKEKLEKIYKKEVTILEKATNEEKEEATHATICMEYLPNTQKVPNEEYYELNITPHQIHIKSTTAHGIFNGTQTLLSMLKGQKEQLHLPVAVIQDYPDLPYRGQMLDIARNFTTIEHLKELIDITSSYKLNVLHLHFSDDEGWRLEIPGLEELTSVGARRGHTTDETECLFPAYENGYNPDAETPGNGFYTRDEFIELLRYAAERHVQVVPEIESPGHARAAITAMKARYKKYINTDPEKATEYMLHDPQDSSRYLSAQWYTDNTMNVALPSTYRFIEKVIHEIKEMYQEAAVPLTMIHVGGDEVATGAWSGSPLCRQLMEDKGMTRTHELAEYFITRVSAYLQQQGISFGGWQEAALDHSVETHALLATRAGGIYCWSTVAEWETDEISYQTANNGYPVIICNVNNCYLDLAYDAHIDERGHFWAGYVDVSKSFSLLPYRIYRSSRTTMAGVPVAVDSMEIGKTPLTTSGRQHIKGVQAQLFTETIRNFEQVEYYTFPKIIGLAERGWNAHPVWETLSGTAEKQAYEQDLNLLYQKIEQKEMPYWSYRHINYRLPYPGLCLKNGQLYANTHLRNGQIHYTTDGTEPTVDDPLWESPIECQTNVIKAKLFYMGKESQTALLKKQ